MTVGSRIAGGLLAAAASFAFVVAAGPVSAQTIEEALAQAYATNPQLGAQRAALRAVDERVAQALSGYRPTVIGRVSGGHQGATSTTVTDSHRTTSNSSVSPKTASIQATQPLYDATVGPKVRSAENQVQAQRATVLITEQQVLNAAATAYMDVVQAQAVLQLNKNNEQVLQRQLDAAQDRFRVGEYTRTDVSQSESRMALAVATRINSEGTLEGTRGIYERTVGSMPGTLKSPKPTFKLPASVDETVELARANNPQVLALSYQEAAQRDNVDAEFGRLLPSANLQASATRTWDAAKGTDAYSMPYLTNRSDNAQVTAQVVIPLYQAGLPEANVRAAKHTANQLRIQIDDQRRQATQSAITGWQALVTSRASIQSYQAQIRSAQIALEGVRQEAQVGSRTLLDVLNQEQELLNARVSLVRSQRDEVVAAFGVLAAVGQLTAQQLHLPVQYFDMEKHYNQVRDKWFGTSVGE